MNSEPRDVGPIEGREVPQTQAEFSEDMQQLRQSRSKGRPNSRPLPSWVERLAWILDSAFRVPGTTDRRVGIEATVGLIPFAGALFDMVYKANIRNLVLMERDLADRRATRRSSLAVLALMVGVVLLGLLMVVLAWFAAIGVLVWFFTRLF